MMNGRIVISSEGQALVLVLSTSYVVDGESDCSSR